MSLQEADYFGETYDYYSIMHYGSTEFSKNGKNTIVALTPGMTEIIGQVDNFSAADLRKINKMYGCKYFLFDGPMGKTSSLSPTTATTSEYDYYY